jgi:NAD-dependent dihydropyrimidine dehydrogenase PreA subunit
MIKKIIRPNHCIRVCDECFEEKKVGYWNIKNKETHLCSSCSNKKAFEAKKDGYKPWNIGLTYQKASGNFYINKSGYKLYYIGDKKYKGGYVAEHRIVMELSLKRRLKQGEVIHHIDGDKANNNLENLLLCNKSLHRSTHHQIENISFKLIQLGIIKFNKEKKQYLIEPYMWEHISKLIELLENPTLNQRQEDNQQRSFLGETQEERSTTIQKWSTLK